MNSAISNTSTHCNNRPHPRGPEALSEVLQQPAEGVADSEDIPKRSVSMAEARATSGELSVECEKLRAVFTQIAGKKIYDVLV